MRVCFLVFGLVLVFLALRRLQLGRDGMGWDGDFGAHVRGGPLGLLRAVSMRNCGGIARRGM